MGPQDAKLAEHILETMVTARRLRLSLASARDGCGCDPRGRCAHHATTHNHLLEAEKALERAARELEHR